MGLVLLMRGLGFGLIGLKAAIIFSWASLGMRNDAAWLESIAIPWFFLTLGRDFLLALSASS